MYFINNFYMRKPQFFEVPRHFMVHGFFEALPLKNENKTFFQYCCNAIFIFSFFLS